MDSSELKTASRHLLVDFENVNKIDGAVSSGEFQIKIFLGEQSKLKADFLNKILKTGHRIELIRISGNGPNALDFHIAFYLGILSDRHRGDAFFILSHLDGGPGSRPGIDPDPPPIPCVSTLALQRENFL
jgi:hypothetical protein